MGGIRIHEAAAVGPEHLDGYLRGHGTLEDRLGVNFFIFHYRFPLGILQSLTAGILFLDLSRVWFDQFRRIIGLEILDHPLGDQEEGIEQADRQKQIEIHPHQVHPEVADGLCGTAGNAPHQGGGDGDPRSGGNKIMERQPHHLRKVGQGRFAAIVLPVGIGGKTGRRVEGQIGAERAKALRIQRQQVLYPENKISEKQADKAEHEHRDGIFLPVLLLFSIHPEKPVKQQFHRLQDGIEKRASFAVQNAKQVKSHRFGQEQEQADKGCELQPSIHVHFVIPPLKQFRPNDAGQKIDDQNDAY